MSMDVHDVMNRRVVTVRVDQTLAEAMRILLEQEINSAPVLDVDGNLVGMIGLKDGLRAPHPSREEVMVHRHTALVERAQALRETQVGAVMARTVITVRPDTPAEEAAALMSNRGRHPLPVVENGQIIGVVSRSDVIHALLNLTDQPPDPLPDSLLGRAR
jgi:CBS-domain-containing membrane protein